MSRLTRRFFIWCLVLVLPLQSLAAGCLMRCDGSPPQTVAVSDEIVAAAQPCHAGAEPDAAGIDAPGHTTGHDTGQRCGDCAACGAAPALPAAPPLLGTPEALRACVGTQALRLASAAVAGPERPPRADAL
jgi:hypothetical protein